MTASGQSQTPYERIGGSKAVRAAVDIMYEKILSDGNCRHFFERTDMRKLKAHQVQFIGYALGSNQNYEGKSMVDTHKHLEGLRMSHFDSVRQHLKEALEELDVDQDLIDQAVAKVDGLRPQFEEATGASTVKETPKSPYERIGGMPAVKAAVDLLYEKLLSDGNCRQFFENSDVTKIKAHQVQFIRFALGGSASYKGKSMVEAHKRLKGLQLVHFHSVARHLAEALQELEVPQGLIDEVINKVDSLEPQFAKAVEIANA